MAYDTPMVNISITRESEQDCSAPSMPFSEAKHTKEDMTC
jgi:hypothetical protein